jgi:hypothetical protein
MQSEKNSHKLNANATHWAKIPKQGISLLGKNDARERACQYDMTRLQGHSMLS